MLYGRHFHVAFTEHGSEHDLADILGASRDVDRLRQIGPTEHDAGIGGSRSHRHQDALTGVQAHTACPHDVLESSLTDHVFFRIRRRTEVRYAA